MKKVISLIMVFMLMTVLLTQVAAAELAAAQSKISPELMSEFSNLRSNETTLAYVEMQDVDHDAVMEEFARRYPEEYAAYVAAKTGSASPLGTASTNEALLQRALELKRAVYRDFYLAQNQAVTSEYVQTRSQLFVSAYSPVTILELDRSTALSLALSDDVVSVSKFSWGDKVIDDPLFPTEMTTLEFLGQLDISNQISRADYLRDTKNLTGAGVKIGIVELGIPDVTNYHLQSASITIRPGDENVSSHATTIAFILAATNAAGTMHGIVPNAQFYCAGFGSVVSEADYGKIYSDIEWLISNGVNIINASFGNEETNGVYESVAQWIDHIATVHDVHFVAAAGNDTGYVATPGIAYNAITVSGFKAKGSDDVTKFSMYPTYGHIEGGESRPEKPNLVANAYFGEYRNSFNQLTDYSGTSFAAPQVTGVIAQLCCWDGNLKFRQNVVGAVLAASAAEKVDSVGNGLQGDVFKAADAINGNLQISNKEGAGILDARWAWGILANHNYWNIIQNGVGKNGTNVFYERTVTINTNVNNLTRIAIYWTKNNTNINHTNNSLGDNPDLTNFNLRVFNSTGREIATSTTAYSNFEIVQFEPVPPGTYRIVIEIVENSNRTEYVGLAIW